MLNYEISEFKVHIAVTQYIRMNELINYISHMTHKILSAIIIRIADKLKIIIVIGDKKNIGPIMQTLIVALFCD